MITHKNIGDNVTASDYNALADACNGIIQVSNINDDYNIQAGDTGKLITVNNGINITVPTGLGIGFTCKFLQLDGGVGTSWTPGEGMTPVILNGFAENVNNGGAYVELYIISDTEYLLRGDLNGA